MMWCVWRVVVWCALAQVARAYTVDCNHEYTDCDTELSKIGADEDEPMPSTTVAQEIARLPPLILPRITTSTTTEKIVSTEKTTTQKPQTVATSTEPTTNRIETTETPKQGRLLNLGGINVDELQNFASLLHNETNPRKPPIKIDLSDVNMDDDDDEPHRMVPIMDSRKHNKPISDKFYSNLQVPFHPLLAMDHASEEADTCKENEVSYKIGERIERGCEEVCECAPGGIFDCTPRCKHPYIRRGRRLTDPLCFETPVDECCSIIACATGNHDQKPLKVPVCSYNNETHSVGDQWHIGCEKTCTCGTNSEVKCKPRCSPLSNSDKCINVQDPNDECCEVQVCDVSQDAHEEPEKTDNVTNSSTTNATTSTTSTTILTESTTLLPTTTENKGFVDYDMVHFAEHPKDSEYLGAVFKPTPLPPMPPMPEKPQLTDPIGSVKVLQNNSVQVNLIHMNNSDNPVYLLLSSDGGKNFENVELKYSNLILNLPGGKDYILKTKDTGAKFNFTITASKENQEYENQTINVEEKIGCHYDGNFYEVGEEFHIGCQELCECTGKDTQECVELVCPSHVGLELVSKGCVRWAPNPPASPPNCCPRTARCLSDGTCYYKGVPVPNWSEVSISLTGCEQRCFCENGELDCQEVCSPLPPVPPQTLRCPPMHRPAPVNISDDDCCKQWGCVPNAQEINKTTHQPFKLELPHEKYIAPVLPTTHAPPMIATVALVPQKIQPTDFYRHLHPVKSISKFVKGPSPPIDEQLKYSVDSPVKSQSGENLTLFTLSEPKPLIEPKPQVNPTPSHILKPPVTPLLPPPPKENVPESLQLLSWKQPGIMMDFRNPDETVKYDSKLPDFTISEDAVHDLLTIPNEHVQLIKHQSKAKAKGEVRYFLPAYGSKILGSHTFVPSHPAPFQKMFLPVMKQNQTVFYFQPKAKQNNIPPQNKNVNLNIYSPNHFSNKKTYAKHLIPSRSSVGKYIAPQIYWNQNGKLPSSHLPMKSPNPYENVLLRPLTIGGPKAGRESPLGLEQLVSQMEMESEVNRNLGRSADKPDDEIEVTEEEGKTPQPGPMTPTLPPQGPQTPPFLPTIPPEVHFPTEDLPDYGQNDLHRPMNREPILPGLPPGLTVPPNYGDENKKLSVLSLQGDSPTSVKLLFGLPPVLVGLRGSVDLRYTDKADEDVSLWTSQVFAPADEVLTTPRLEFRLTGLKPSTTYKIKGKLFLHNLPVEPESDVYQVRTMDLPLLSPPPPIEEKRREIDSALTVVDVNDTVAHLSWRHFSEDELRFIDGIQVRYRPVGTPIYSMTELLHHSRSIAELVDLRPGTRYEASLVLIPPPRATTELQDPGRVEFTTAPFVDPYNWSVTIEARVVGSDAAELTWSGVPSPAERWVRIYRAAHTCGSTRHEHDAFRLAARDLPPSILLNGLETNAKCRVWLELFMTNGKIKTSNVLEINTKSQDSPEEIDNEIELASVADSREAGRGDYYGALVVVGVVASLGALTSLLLLLVLVRRHRPRSVPITPVPTAPREASLPPYDNPAYKLELQQETMDL